MKDGQSDVGGEHARLAIGVSYHVEGELRRRSGLTKFCDIGGTAIGTFTDTRGVTWLIVVESDGEIRAVNFAAPTTSTAIATGYDVTAVATIQSVNGRVYITNGFDPVQVWNGLSATSYDAGIAAPSAAPGSPTTASGNGTAGVHLIRYRFLDNTSPASSYRSDASANLSQTVTASGTDGQMTFSIGSSGTNIIRSTDSKVTTIQVEMTVAGGTTFYVAAAAQNAATSVVVSISDTNLALADRGDLFDSGNLIDGDDLGTGNEQPPLGTIIAQCRDYTFLGGDVAIPKTIGVTNASTTVTGTGFPAEWAGRQLLRVGTDATTHLVQSVNAAGDTITLANAYGGSTNASASGVFTSRNPNQISWSAYVSGASLPESWSSDRARDVLNSVGDTLRGFIEFNGDLIICGEFSMQRLVFVNDPGTGELNTLQGQFGVFNQRCFVKHEGILMGFGPNGAWLTTGGRPRWISDDIDATWESVADLSQASKYHASFDPVTKTVRWLYVADSESVPREVLTYDISGGRWYREQFRAGMSASTTAVNDDGQLRTILSDATNGRTFFLAGATDGVPSTSTGAYTGDSGSTTTVTNVTDSLPTGTLADLSGLILYQPSSGEEVAITSNTASAITHAALTTAVAQGEAVYVGSIPFTYETCWWDGGDMADAKRAALVIHCVPSGSVSAKARVYLYQDWQTSPMPFTNEAGNPAPRGVTITNRGTYAEIEFASTTDCSGYIRMPMFLNFNRVIRAKLEILTPAGTLRILDMRFEPPKRGDVKPKVVNE